MTSQMDDSVSTSSERRKLSIAVFHFGFFYSGGGEKLVLEEVRGLKALGHDVTCYAPYVDREGCFPDYPEIKEVKRLLPHPPKWIPLSDAIWVLASCLLIPIMAPRFREHDVFLGANQPAPWLAYVLSRLLRRPYVIYLAQPLRLLHPRDIDRQKGLRIQDGDQRFVKLLTQISGPLIDRLDRKSVEAANSVITNGSHIAGWIGEIYGVDTVLCPAGCNPVPQDHLIRKDALNGTLSVGNLNITKPFILLTNRHSPMKRFEYALWVMKKISRSFEDLQLVITGQETEYTDQLKYLVDGLGLTDKVRFVGLVSEIDLQNLYSQASVYVYTSPEEDFGMGIIEAMAAGTPVVAWDVAGPTTTVISGRTGYLARPYDTDEFAEDITILLRSPDLAKQMGIRGHKRAADLFSFEQHNIQLERFIRAAVDNAEPLIAEKAAEDPSNAYILGDIYHQNE